jgi:hypothetical protein
MILIVLKTLIALAACGVILIRAEPALNRMGTRTRLTVRIAMHLMVVGATCQLLEILLGRPPDGLAVLLLAACAAMLMCERRMRVLVPLSKIPRGGTAR